MTLVRLLDVALVVVTVPVIALLGAPWLGLLVGAAVWIVQRFAALAIEGRARRADTVRAGVTMNLAAAFGRAWIVGLAILAVGLAGSREDGLAAAVLVLIAFTVYLATSLLTRSLERSSAAS